MAYSNPMATHDEKSNLKLLAGEYIVIRDERHQGFLPCVAEVREGVTAACSLVLTNYRVRPK